MVAVVGVVGVVAGVGAFLAVGQDGPSSNDPSTGGVTQIGPDRAEDTLRDYLAALADGDYEDASSLLVGGDEPLDQRIDLAPLQLDELSVESVAEALSGYCGDGCVSPVSLTLGDPDRDRGYVAIVEFGEPRGHPLRRSFVVWATPTGRPYVRGLPPSELSPIPAGADT